MNWFDDDVALAALLADILPGGVRRVAEEPLRQMGQDAAGKLDGWAFDANANPPVLRSWDRQGQRIDHIEQHHSYRQIVRLAVESGMIGRFYGAERHRWQGAAHRVKFAMGYLFSQAEQGFYCPACLTDGTARLVERHGSDQMKRRHLGPLTSMDFDEAHLGAMYLTERQGGSDVGANETEARKGDDGRWRLYGEKWFCSNCVADVAMVLARPEGAARGTRGLGLFLVPKLLDDGTRNAYAIRRLKDKLGTRSMPTGEIEFEGAVAYPVGELGQGFRYMTDMLNMSRLYNAVASLGVIRRALREAAGWAAGRSAFGHAVRDFPLVRSTLVGLAVDLEASLRLVFEAVTLLDAADEGAATEADLARLRLLTPLAKLHTARVAVHAASEALEVLGGNGYIEEYVTPRLVRDAHVLPVWEGTTNILSLDAFRAIEKAGAHKALFDDIGRKLAGAAPGSRGGAGELDGLRGSVRTAAADLEESLWRIGQAPPELSQLHVRPWCERAARVYEAALLIQAADKAGRRAEGAGRASAIALEYHRRYVAPAWRGTLPDEYAVSVFEFDSLVPEAAVEG